jgi:hypothetical protein
MRFRVSYAYNGVNMHPESTQPNVKCGFIEARTLDVVLPECEPSEIPFLRS